MSLDGDRLELVHGTGGHGRERLGTVRVANEVVARISALAALEVDGVHAMYSAGGSQQLDRILRRHAAHRGVKVELLDDDRLRLDVFVVMEAGTHLPVMGASVQGRVADAIDRMLGLAIAEVNVFVSEVVFS